MYIEPNLLLHKENELEKENKAYEKCFHVIINYKCMYKTCVINNLRLYEADGLCSDDRLSFLQS